MTPCARVYLPDQPRLDLLPADAFHHGQMFQVVMGLEEGVASEELDQDAANAPDVTRIAPPQTQDDLGRAIVPRRHDRRMVFILERGRAKVDEPDLGIVQHPPLTSGSADRGRRGRDLAVVRETLRAVVDEQDVLGLQIRADQIEIMQD